MRRRRSNGQKRSAFSTRPLNWFRVVVRVHVAALSYVPDSHVHRDRLCGLGPCHLKGSCALVKPSTGCVSAPYPAFEGSRACCGLPFNP
jgi:hypothetical protein